MKLSDKVKARDQDKYKYAAYKFTMKDLKELQALEQDLYIDDLEAENKKLREGIASIIRDSKNDGSYLIVPIRKLLELNQAQEGQESK